MVIASPCCRHRLHSAARTKITPTIVVTASPCCRHRLHSAARTNRWQWETERQEQEIPRCLQTRHPNFSTNPKPTDPATDSSPWTRSTGTQRRPSWPCSCSGWWGRWPSQEHHTPDHTGWVARYSTKAHSSGLIPRAYTFANTYLRQGDLHANVRHTTERVDLTRDWATAQFFNPTWAEIPIEVTLCSATNFGMRGVHALPLTAGLNKGGQLVFVSSSCPCYSNHIRACRGFLNFAPAPK